jgi:hypothetical protein
MYLVLKALVWSLWQAWQLHTPLESRLFYIWSNFGLKWKPKNMALCFRIPVLNLSAPRLEWCLLQPISSCLFSSSSSFLDERTFSSCVETGGGGCPVCGGLLLIYTGPRPLLYPVKQIAWDGWIGVLVFKKGYDCTVPFFNARRTVVWPSLWLNQDSYQKNIWETMSLRIYSYVKSYI